MSALRGMQAKRRAPGSNLPKRIFGVKNDGIDLRDLISFEQGRFNRRERWAKKALKKQAHIRFNKICREKKAKASKALSHISMKCAWGN
jgi:hypothetical protein